MFNPSRERATLPCLPQQSVNLLDGTCLSRPSSSKQLLDLLLEASALWPLATPKKPSLPTPQRQYAAQLAQGLGQS